MRSFPLAYALAFLVLAAVGYAMADGFTRRVSHHQGFDLVAVDDPSAPRADELAEWGYHRPRHTVLDLVDGLSERSARPLRTVEAMRRAGQCARADVGPIPVSRPVYTTLSSGVEQNRTGVRMNGPTAPAEVESVWEVARRHGLVVTGVSEVRWWAELFPSGFDAFFELERPVNYSRVAPLRDLTLVHPNYVDEAGHDHGANGKEYAEAVARADDEALELLGRLDLQKDTFVFLADHGHALRGGHGGLDPLLTHVVVCFAGKGIRKAEGEVAMSLRTVGPLLSVLLGVPFPRHMRATDDDLESIFRVLDLGSAPEYEANRRRAVEAFRAKNRTYLEALLPGTSSWAGYYAALGKAASTRAAIGLVVLVGAIGALYMRRRMHESLVALAYAIGALGLTVGAWIALRGSFDMTSANTESEFTRVSLAETGTLLALAAIVHVASLRAPRRWLDDHALLCAVLVGLLVVHVVAYGWPVGPVLPVPASYFGALFAAVTLAVAGVLGFIGTVAMVLFRRDGPSRHAGP